MSITQDINYIKQVMMAFFMYRKYCMPVLQNDSRDAYTEVGGRATQEAKAEGGGTITWK